MKNIVILILVLKVLYIIGWCRCVYKTISCNWDPIGKAEVIYTVGTFTGLGGIIGYFNIEDK